LQHVAVRCSVMQCIAVCCSVLQCDAVCYSVLQCVAVRCSVLQRVAVRCSVLQCGAVWCGALGFKEPYFHTFDRFNFCMCFMHTRTYKHVYARAHTNTYTLSFARKHTRTRTHIYTHKRDLSKSKVDSYISNKRDLSKIKETWIYQKRPGCCNKIDIFDKLLQHRFCPPVTLSTIPAWFKKDLSKKT